VPGFAPGADARNVLDPLDVCIGRALGFPHQPPDVVLPHEPVDPVLAHVVERAVAAHRDPGVPIHDAVEVHDLQ